MQFQYRESFSLFFQELLLQDELRMNRIKDTYLETIQSLVPFEGKVVLEVGCGNGSRTVQIAHCCEQIIAIDPDPILLEAATAIHPLLNGEYLVAPAEALPVQDHRVDVVFFTLSLHHVPVEKMHEAIDEAIRVVKREGHIVFFEPTFSGTFFAAEILFDACDGDERREKAAAYVAMLSHTGLREIAERFDETIFSFESTDDFISSMHPKRDTRPDIEEFLAQENFTLHAERRINVFTPV